MWSTSKRYYLEQNEFYDLIPVQAIGNGRYGDVFECFSPSRQKSFAVKVSQLNRDRPQIGILPELIDQHDDICYIYDVLHGQKTQVIISQLCDTTFRSAKSDMSVGLLFFTLKKIAFALQNIHNENAYHLDIKQNNILLKTSPKGLKVLLNDFGLSIKNPMYPELCRITDVVAFFRMIFKLAGLPSEDFPEKQGYSELKIFLDKYLLERKKQIKVYWMNIMKFILQPFGQVPSMWAIGCYIDLNLQLVQKQQRVKNFVKVHFFHKNQDVHFHQFFQNYKFDGVVQEEKILPVIAEEEEIQQEQMPEKSKSIKKTRDAPSRLMKALSSRKKKRFQRIGLAKKCTQCGRMVRVDNRKHTKTCN